jgi:hypothetical protein
VPNLFSFNSPLGACPSCRGYGRIIGIDYGLVVPDDTKSLAEGAVKPWQTGSYGECQDDLEEFARRRGVPLEVPWRELSEDHRRWVIEGEGAWQDGKWYGLKRFFNWLQTKSYRMQIRVLPSRNRTYMVCPACGGARLKPEALLWRLGGTGAGDAGCTIRDLALLPIDRCREFFERLEAPALFEEAAGLLLARRYKRLSPHCTYTLQQAAVIGETFRLEELGLLFAQRAGATLDEVIEVAVAHGLLLRDAKGGEYRFSHAVIHQTILSHLPHSELQFYCSRLAALVEDVHSENLMPWARKLAHWYSRVASAEGRVKHRTYVLLAADEAIKECAWEESLSLYRTIITPTSTAGDEGDAEALFGMGRACSMARDRKTGAQFFRKAFDYYKNRGCVDRMIDIATQLGYLKTGEPGFYNFFEDVLRVVPKGSVKEGMVLHFYGVARFLSLGEYEGAEKNLLRSFEIGDREGDLTLKTRALCALAYLDIRFHRVSREHGDA